jgi:SAM-dependent methyltransferase
MQPLIKLNLDAVLHSGGPVVVELGCGPSKKPGVIGIDRVDSPQVDIVADLEAGLGFLPDNSVDRIGAHHLLEHIENFELLMSEIVRVLKRGGICQVRVPHFSNPYGYSDYTHRRFFGLYSFYYFVDNAYQLGRKVPSRYSDIRIRIISQRFIFSSRTSLGRIPAKLLRMFVNLNRATQEWYEARPWICPCDVLEIVFTPDKKG